MHLLLIMAVFWCGVHSFVPDHAIADMGNEACAQTDPASDGSQETPVGPSKPDHVSHQHCPVAPDRQGGADQIAFSSADSPLFAPPAAVLHSRSQAPPLQPPAA
jgi:hypothetical protein